MKKQIVLKNGMAATINTGVTENIYYICATDAAGKEVGLCKFDISYTFARKLSEEAKLRYAKSHHVPLTQVPSFIKKELPGAEKFLAQQNASISGNSKKLSADGKILTLASGRQYFLEKSICNLNSITILDKKFLNIGLGTAMLKAMEAIAQQAGCEYVKAFCLPNGEFFYATNSFYKRNGFYFDTHAGLTYVFKSLSKEKDLTK